MGFEELAALKQQLSKRAQADKPQRSQAERPARDPRGSQEPLGAQGRVQGTKASSAPGAQSPKPRNASTAPAARSGPADGAPRNRHRHGDTGKPGNGGFAGRRPGAPTRTPPVEQTVNGAGLQQDAAATPRKPGEQAQRGPRPPRPEKRVQPPVEPVVITIGQLQKRFPLAFPKNPAPKSPLKLGISKDLIAQAEALSLSEADLLEAIKVWCQGSRYWAAMTKGAARVNLEGQPEGIVTPEQAAHARSLAAATRRAKHGIVLKKKGEPSVTGPAQSTVPAADAQTDASADDQAETHAETQAENQAESQADLQADSQTDVQAGAQVDEQATNEPSVGTEPALSTQGTQNTESDAHIPEQADSPAHVTAPEALPSPEMPAHSPVSSH